jgi:hypothetical protein
MLPRYPTSGKFCLDTAVAAMQGHANAKAQT